MSKGFSRGFELEKVLLQKMEERYLEGRCSREVSDYFEDCDVEPNFSVLGDLTRRSVRVIDPEGGGGVSGVPAAALRDGHYPPTTNRGVTFHANAKGGCEEEVLQYVNSRNGSECPKVMGGFDGGVEVGFEGEWDKSKFRELLPVLTAAKDGAQIPGNDERFFSIQDNVFLMNPRSAGGGVTYSFVFEGRGVKFYIHSNPVGGIQPVRIRYGAECLIGQDLYTVHADVREFLESLGFSITGEKISRVDLQVMVHRDISEFMFAIKEKRVVCTARRYAIIGDGFEKSAETFTLGKDIQICIYDKRQELFDTMGREPHKFALMVLNCFGEDWLTDGTPTTRVEFRIRRDVLKDMGINTIADLQEYELGLARYCCHSWFRLLEEPKKKGHSHEQRVDPVWREVQVAFSKWFPGRVDGENKPVKRLYVRPLLCSAKQYVQQAVGCMSKAAALFMNGASNSKEIMEFVMNIIRSNSVTLVQKVIDSSVELGIRAGVMDPLSVRDAFVIHREDRLKIPIRAGGLREVV